MIWNEFLIKTNSAGAAVLEERLSAIGIVGLATEDPSELREVLERREVPWDYVDESLLAEGESKLTFYLSDNAADKEMAKQAREVLDELRSSGEDFGLLSLEEQRIDDEDWADNWKQYFKPLEIGKRLVIKPSWEQYEPKNGQIVLELDPASSFGTGQHETTALCLEMMEKELEKKADKNVKLLDMGCGSGILGIAGLLFGAEKAVAVDIDENAVHTSLENADKNGVSDKYTAYSGDVLASKYLRVKLGKEKYDLILANIVADVLAEMSGILLELATPGALIICSGIIAPKAHIVSDAFRAKGAAVEFEVEKNDWVALGIRK